MIQKEPQLNEQISLYDRVVKGGAWVFSLRMIQQILGIVRLLILARILAPHDFGLMGIALITMSTLETFSQTGFQSALIQKKENIDAYLNTAWTYLMIRGISLCGLLYLAAPHAAVFFSASEAEAIMKVLGLSVMIQSCQNIGIIYFRKELQFNKQFLYEFCGTVSDFIVAISAALILRNVWALVLGVMVRSIVTSVMSYYIHPFRPRFSFDRAKARELFGFGKWVFGSGILVFLLTQGDDIFVGKMLGVAALGFYQMAYKISNMPATEITRVISSVTFPAYSVIQRNHERLREAYLNVFKVSAYLSIPVAAFIFCLAPDITHTFFGEKWVPMIPAMMILAWWGVIRGLVGSISPVFYAIGRPDLVTKMQFWQTILLCALVYPLTHYWNITGTATAVLVSALVMFFIRSHVLLTTIKLEMLQFYRPIVSSLIIAAVSVLPLMVLKQLLRHTVNVYILFLFAGIFFSMVLGLICTTDESVSLRLKALYKMYRFNGEGKNVS